MKKNRQIQTLQAQLLQVKEAQQLEKQGTQHSLEDLLANVELSTTGDLDNAQTEQSSAGVSPTKASSAPPSPQPATPASASAQQPPRENSVEGLSREERSRLALLEADKNILLVEMEYLQHEVCELLFSLLAFIVPCGHLYCRALFLEIGFHVFPHALPFRAHHLPVLLCSCPSTGRRMTCCESRSRSWT